VIGIAERYGVSRQAVHGWLRRYRTGGLDALADRSHRPRRCPHQMPAASRPTCASYATTIQAGANAASLTSLPGSASTHRPG
jgi:transposase-like protein